MKNPTPSQKTLRKLEALRILTSNVYDVVDIAETFRLDGVISDRQMIELRSDSDKTERLFILLEQARSEGKIDLLDYEWRFLPNHVVVLTSVTKSGIKEFRYEGS